ncbi:unnamed protein product [Acanthoscelides obtectus]|uniref:Uncharacterized protein n=1 Tax=Acanthoscelides obtectus TaxID=200917 RepID=A0A9P0MFS1_ACAOB|nr:unnamed protein product [Acanthoscelides obtectus]CAK1671578.1 hypothetical protein AOBTE_LOCUS28335 [Acanthoscelides obtectus]
MRSKQFSKHLFHSFAGRSKTAFLMRQLLLLVTGRSLFLIFGKVKKSLGLRQGLYGGWSNNSTFSSVKYCLVFGLCASLHCLGGG